MKTGRKGFSISRPANRRISTFASERVREAHRQKQRQREVQRDRRSQSEAYIECTHCPSHFGMKIPIDLMGSCGNILEFAHAFFSVKIG